MMLQQKQLNLTFSASIVGTDLYQLEEGKKHDFGVENSNVYLTAQYA